MNTVNDLRIRAAIRCPRLGLRMPPSEIPTREEILILDFKTGDHQAFVRTSNEEFRTVEWREVSGKSLQHSKPTGLGLR